MKKLLTWIMLTLLLMIGFPWLVVTFADSAGMVGQHHVSSELSGIIDLTKYIPENALPLENPQ